MGALISDHEEAKRLARVIISDILAYNGEKVEKGIKEDNLFEQLKNELHEGEMYYRSRVEPEICSNFPYFNFAIVDILVNGKSYIETDIW